MLESPMKVRMERFEEAVRAAVDAIPGSFQPYLQDIEFVVAKRSSEGLLGMYEGPGALGAGDFPARVTVFKEAHEAVCDSWEELVAEVRRTVFHEVGHHFDMEEDELPY
jgi:predicted Zn-dependent protease with MMP-like domain